MYIPYTYLVIIIKIFDIFTTIVLHLYCSSRKITHSHTHSASLIHTSHISVCVCVYTSFRTIIYT